MNLIKKTNQRGPGFKIAVVGFLSLILLIPTAFVRSVLDERVEMEKTAKNEVYRMRGGETYYVHAPIMSIPIKVRKLEAVIDEEGKEVGAKFGTPKFKSIFAVPNTTNMELQSEVSTRKKGIFSANISTTKVDMSGEFVVPKPDQSDVKKVDFFIDQAKVYLPGRNLATNLDEYQFIWNGKKLKIRPNIKSQKSNWDFPYYVEIPSMQGVASGDRIAFELHYKVDGGDSLQVLPNASGMNVRMQSNWLYPKFSGSQLPISHGGKDGVYFSEWRGMISDMNKLETDEIDAGAAMGIQQWTDGAFGVDFYQPVGHYQKVERSIKYALLIIGLTFLVFFMFEILLHLNVHPIQYLLTGSALVVFFLLLLSMSELIDFHYAYAMSSIATVGLIGSYAQFAIGGVKRAALLSFLMMGMFGFLYVLIVRQDYSLVFGSVALFVILSLVMFFTRKFDWYQIGQEVGSTKSMAKEAI